MRQRFVRTLAGLAALLFMCAARDDLSDGKHVAGMGWSGWNSAVFVFDTDSSKHTVIDLPPATQSRYNWRQPIRVNWVNNDLPAIDFDSEQAEVVDLSGGRVAKLGERFIRRLPQLDVSCSVTSAITAAQRR